MSFPPRFQSTEWWHRPNYPTRLPNQFFGEIVDETQLSLIAQSTGDRSNQDPSTSQDGQSEIKNDNKEFQVMLSVQQFQPEEVTVKIAEGYIVVHGKHEERQDGESDRHYVSREFTRRYALPNNCEIGTVKAFTFEGVLMICATKKTAITEQQVPVIKLGNENEERLTEKEVSAFDINFANTDEDAMALKSEFESFIRALKEQTDALRHVTVLNSQNTTSESEVPISLQDPEQLPSAEGIQEQESASVATSVDGNQQNVLEIQITHEQDSVAEARPDIMEMKQVPESSLEAVEVKQEHVQDTALDVQDEQQRVSDVKVGHISDLLTMHVKQELASETTLVALEVTEEQESVTTLTGIEEKILVPATKSDSAVEELPETKSEVAQEQNKDCEAESLQEQEQVSGVKSNGVEEKEKGSDTDRQIWERAVPVS